MAEGEPNVNGPNEDQGQRGLHLRGVAEAPSDEADTPAYDGVGADLKAAREDIGSTCAEFASQLRIREPYLSAIEDGRFDDLPGPVYAGGFIRSYADAVGLDGNEFVSRFKHESAARPDQTRLRFPAPEVESRLPSGRLLVLSLFFVGAVYAGWYYLSNVDRSTVEQIPTVPERLLTSNQDNLPANPPWVTSAQNAVENNSGLSRANAATASMTLVGTEPPQTSNIEPNATVPDREISALPGSRREPDAANSLATNLIATTNSAPAAVIEGSARSLHASSSPSASGEAVGLSVEPDAQAIEQASLAEQDLPVSASPSGDQTSLGAAMVSPGPARVVGGSVGGDSVAMQPVVGPIDESAVFSRDLRQRPGRDRLDEQTSSLATDTSPTPTGPTPQVAAADIDIEQPMDKSQSELAALSVPKPPTVDSGRAASDEAPAATRLPGNGNGESRVTLTALLDSWVQVVGESNELLLTRILRAGDTYFVPNRPGLLLLTGNAGALEVSVDGQALPPIGPIGAVRRNVSLDPENLLSTAGQPAP